MKLLPKTLKLVSTKPVGPRFIEATADVSTCGATWADTSALR